MRTTTALILTLFFSIPSAFAGIAETTPGTGEIEKVKLSSQATVSIDGTKTTLTQLGAGLRRKKVAVFWAKVNVVQFFASDTKKIAPGTPVSAVHEELSTKNGTVAIALTLLRDLTPSQIKAAFQDALKHNDVDPSSAALAPLMEAISGLGKQTEGGTIWLVMRKKPDGSETVYFEDAKGELRTIQVEKGQIKNLLLIWFGKPADSGMEQLQEQMIPKAEKTTS